MRSVAQSFNCFYEGLTDEEMFHQSMAFFIAGNDTTAATMGFLFYHLATEPGIQDKVYEEVDELVKTNVSLHVYVRKRGL